MKTTESDSLYNDLEKMELKDLLFNMNQEDHKVAPAVKLALPQIEKLVSQIVNRMKNGGKLFYIGAGTSGRLGVVDASECPPTFGVPHDLVIGIIAGGDKAIRKSVEHAEDDTEQAWKDLLHFNPTTNDTLIGIAASGTTPYVIGGIKIAEQKGLLTGCIVCNKDTPLSKATKNPIEVELGPEFITGSTRLKSGTAQKMILNLISTTVMIQLGKVKGNKMVDMQLSNNKLKDRGLKMVMNSLQISEIEAKKLIEKHKSVRGVLTNFEKK